jgi:4-amino-4-deoxy-L-arabinose transferase-like glycosyltransferase
MPPDALPPDPRRAARLLAAILLAGLALRAAWVWRPLDHRMRAPWRQADYTQIARNYAREDANLLHPRIDWRADGDGLVEMEFPIVPWTAGMLDRQLGYHEAFLRVLSCLLEAGSFLLFVGLARRLLPGPGALAAAALYALSPLLIDLATAMQPEPLMLFLSLLAMVLLERHRRTGSAGTLLVAGLAVGGAILAKAPAACLGLVFTFVVLERSGPRALARASVWGAAALALLPPLVWYAWAKRLFLLHGNSLGLSNEYPFLGLDMLARPTWIYGLLKWETLGVVTPLGWLLLAAALRAPRPRTALPLAWLGSVWVFYIAAARTAADDWAFYYHAASTAPACLLMGAGFAALGSDDAPRVLGLGPGRMRRLAAAGLLAGTLAGLAVATVALVWVRDHREDLKVMRECGLRFLPQIPPGRLIVARGGTVADEDGMPTAHNQSMLFAWLDRRGFTYGDEELSIPRLEGIAARGGRYWIAQAEEIKGPLGAAVAERYRLLARCDPGYYLYDLRSAPDDTAP